MADSTGSNESITEVIPKVLGKYLVANTSLKEYYPGFPSPHQKIKTPSVSILAPSPEFRALAPYLVQKPASGEIVNAKSLIKWVVGIYDVSLQVDLWAGSKEERDDLFDSVFNAMSPNIDPMGLILSMDEYFGQLCDYAYVGHETADTEEQAQRDEWRVTLNVLATCKAIRTKKEFIIETTDTAAEIDAQGEVSTTLVVPTE